MERNSIILTCGIILLLSGCARMKVTKVSQGDLSGHSDDEVSGFRYYLSRPYVHVKKPIYVRQWTELYYASDNGEPISVPCSGEIRGWTETELQRDTGAMAAASVSEMETIRELLQTAESTATPGSPGPPETDGKVEEPSGSQNVTAISDEIEIVFLPDLDEQYAVHGQNCMSKQDYKLKFQDGWMLTGVGSNADSTPVAIEILNVVNTAIESARNVGMVRADKTAKLSPPTVTAGLENVEARGGENSSSVILYERISRSYIRPGLYRINKPWETNGEMAAGCGLIAQLGLPVTTECVVERPAAFVELPAVLSTLGHE